MRLTRFWLRRIDFANCDGAVLVDQYNLPSGRLVLVYSTWCLP